MQQNTNYYMEILKFNFIENKINKESKNKVFAEVYEQLKEEYSIDLYARKKGTEGLYTLIEEDEIRLFSRLILLNLKSKGYRIYIPKNLNLKNNEVNKEAEINKIKTFLKAKESDIQVEFYRNLYGVLAVKNINLYARRKNKKKALLDFIESSEVGVLNECFNDLVKKYNLKV